MNRSIFTYLHHTIADEDIMSSSDDGDDLTFRFNKDGTIPGTIVSKLFEQWTRKIQEESKDKTSTDLGDDPEPDYIPILISAYQLGRGGTRERFKKSKIYKTVQIPGFIERSGRIDPNADLLPWIGRQFLSPSESPQGEVPIIGLVDDFECWVNQNSYSPATWDDAVTWTAGMIDAVVKSPPDGFVLTDQYSIRTCKVVRGANANIRRLYEEILRNPESSGLSRTLSSEKRPRNVSLRLRLNALGQPQGSMTSEYSLSGSQSEALVAANNLKVGEVLAVNGPPGTGKTTLIQAIIATEVVKSAIAGGEPTLIVGVDFH